MNCRGLARSCFPKTADSWSIHFSLVYLFDSSVLGW